MRKDTRGVGKNRGGEGVWIIFAPDITKINIGLLELTLKLEAKTPDKEIF